MITRLLAAAVGLAVLVPAVLFGGPVAVVVIVALAGLVALDEYARMAFPDDHPVALAWLVAVTAGVHAAVLLGGFGWLGGALVTGILATLMFVVLRPGPELSGAADRAGRYVAGITWIGGFLVFVPLLRQLEQGVAWVFLLMVIPWASDTGGYFAGRFLGRHKLYPRVSPKKTWEGYVGGLVAAVLGVFAVRAVGLPILTVPDCLFLGLVLGTAGVLGDLVESMFKRAFDVKDSGWIMPGHGGLLDRVDSLLFVGPLLYLYAVVFKGL